VGAHGGVRRAIGEPDDRDAGDAQSVDECPHVLRPVNQAPVALPAGAPHAGTVESDQANAEHMELGRRDPRIEAIGGGAVKEQNGGRSGSPNSA